jgi:hypothetical protein
VNQPNLTMGNTQAGLPVSTPGLNSTRLRKAGTAIATTSETQAERLLWQGIVQALLAMVWAIRRGKLGQEREKCERCGH